MIGPIARRFREVVRLWFAAVLEEQVRRIVEEVLREESEVSAAIIKRYLADRDRRDRRPIPS